MAEDSLTIECRSQGIPKTILHHDQLAGWIQAEDQFWNSLAALDRQYVIGNTNFGEPGILNGYRVRLRQVMAELNQGHTGALVEYIKAAEDLEIILSQGSLAALIKRLVERQETATAQRLILTFSESAVKPRDEIRGDVAPFKVALKYNPFQVTTADVISASDALKEARKTKADMQDAKSELVVNLQEIRENLEVYVKGTTEDLKALHEMYESYLILQGPSRHWKRISQMAMRYALGSFALFVIMLALPGIFIVVNWASIAAYIDHVLDVTKGSISIASLVVFTVPVLAYGWLLKHISRVFAQNLVVNADAEHRRVMAITFLGLAKRKSVGISEQDRALILNALFRPSPTSPQDDGPPSGLLELIKK